MRPRRSFGRPQQGSLGERRERLLLAGAEVRPYGNLIPRVIQIRTDSDGVRSGAECPTLAKST